MKRLNLALLCLLPLTAAAGNPLAELARQLSKPSPAKTGNGLAADAPSWAFKSTIPPQPAVLDGYTFLRLTWYQAKFQRTCDNMYLGAALLPKAPRNPKLLTDCTGFERDEGVPNPEQFVQERIQQLGRTGKFYFDDRVKIAWSDRMQKLVLTFGNADPIAPLWHSTDPGYAYEFEYSGPHWTKVALGADFPDRLDYALHDARGYWQVAVIQDKNSFDVLNRRDSHNRVFVTIGEPKLHGKDQAGRDLYLIPVNVDRVEYNDGTHFYVWR